MFLAAFSTTSLSLSIFHSQISQEISMKYKNMSVNIMSEINTIKNRPFISCLLCCRFWPMGGGNSCRFKFKLLLACYCALLKIANCKGISRGHYRSLNTIIRVLTKQQQNNYQWRKKISLLTKINSGYQHVTIVT